MFPQRRGQPAKMARRPQIVGIQKRNQRAARFPQTVISRRCRSAIRLAQTPALRPPREAVGGTIVHQNDLDAVHALLADRGKRLIHQLAGIPDRNDHADFRTGHNGSRNP